MAKWDDSEALVVANGGLARFGWPQARLFLPAIACKGQFVASRVDSAPSLFSFCSRTLAVRAALACQTVTDWVIADESGAWVSDDLVPFASHLGTYLVVVDDEEEFIAACHSRTFLLRLFVAAIRAEQPIINSGACIVPIWQFAYRPWLVRTGRGLIADLIEPAVIGDGWRGLPVGAVSAKYVRIIAGVLPDLPLIVWACGSSALYGHEAILQRYVGGACVAGQPVPIRGKLQHGWQVGTGLDGELGFRLEVTMLKLPAFVWSSSNLVLAREAGIDAKAVGAPFLYLDDDPMGQPVCANQLLAMPTHSVPEYRIGESNWHGYGQRMLAIAKEHGMQGVTVCLHPLDYTVGARAALEQTGCIVTQLAFPWEAPQETLLRFRTMVLAHTAVTADRVCSAAFYTLLCRRPFFVSGPAIQTDPVDPDEGPSGDPVWIAAHFPTLRIDQIDRDMALHELGAENKRTPTELKQLIWGWLDD